MGRNRFATSGRTPRHFSFSAPLMCFNSGWRGILWRGLTCFASAKFWRLHFRSVFFSRRIRPQPQPRQTRCAWPKAITTGAITRPTITANIIGSRTSPRPRHPRHSDSTRRSRTEHATQIDIGNGRSPEVSPSAFSAQPPDLQPVPWMDTDFAVTCPLVQHRMPQIRFLYIGSRLCSTLRSDPASRRRPCASLSLHVHHVVKRTCTS